MATEWTHKNVIHCIHNWVSKKLFIETRRFLNASGNSRNYALIPLSRRRVFLPLLLGTLLWMKMHECWWQSSAPAPLICLADAILYCTVLFRARLANFGLIYHMTPPSICRISIFISHIYLPNAFAGVLTHSPMYSPTLVFDESWLQHWMFIPRRLFDY